MPPLPTAPGDLGTAGSRPEALAAVVQLKPELVIVDVALPDALQLMRDLRSQTPTTRIVAFAVEEEISVILDCAESGAAGFVSANASISELVSSLERTIAGELLCSPRMAAELLQRAAGLHRPREAGDTPDGLTRREQEVYGYVCEGSSNKEIASALNISEATVKHHVHHLLEKLKVPTRLHAVRHLGDAGSGLRARTAAPSRRIG